MARITIEDCLDQVDGRFELVKIAIARVRQLHRGAPGHTEDILHGAESFDRDDKLVVQALRNIADGDVTADILKDSDRKAAEFKMAETVHSSASNFKFNDS